MEVHNTDLDIKQLPGAEVSRLSTDEYFKRFHEQETKKNTALRVELKCMRDRIETLKKEILVKDKLSKIENNRAVEEVTKFWRNSILEGETYGGKMVRAALRNKIFK